MDKQNAKALRAASLGTPTDLSTNAVRDVSGALNALLADLFALYFKTKNFTGTSPGRTFATITSFSTSKLIRSSPPRMQLRSGFGRSVA